eukprot:gnl/Trimastix_PCT/3354.p1 GENE.gnl/Trimastix_PCT/3354~~gnl/Trimastix_PCT/3354.p1  ORF type:complete len:217 (+),score=21.61 gnl/Trimastix_PCT/3354:29-652(+)
MEGKRALLVIDLQHDFLEGGSLAVPNGSEIIAPINAFRERIPFDLVVFSKDWHPQDHSSFAANNPGAAVMSVKQLPSGPQVMWPTHCVQQTHGAEIHPDVHIEPSDSIVFKGQNTQVDSYSAFFDNDHSSKTDLDDLLKTHGITKVYCVGLAYDYCVSFTAKDACDLGYETYFVEDLARGIAASCMAKAKEEMIAKGIHVVQSHEIV